MVYAPLLFITYYLNTPCKVCLGTEYADAKTGATLCCLPPNAVQSNAGKQGCCPAAQNYKWDGMSAHVSLLLLLSPTTNPPKQPPKPRPASRPLLHRLLSPAPAPQANTSSVTASAGKYSAAATCVRPFPYGRPRRTETNLAVPRALWAVIIGRVV